MEHNFTEQMDLKKLTAICRKETLTPEDWVYISEYQHLTEDFMREFKDELDWDCISANQYLTEDFMREFADKFNRSGWANISVYQHMAEDFMREFADRLDWWYIPRYQHLSEDFMREFADKLDWDRISRFQHLTENFMKEFADKLAWDYVSIYQHLSEDFMRKYASKLNWSDISEYQELTDDFISEFADKIDIAYVNDSWRKKSATEKKAAVEETGLYECHEDYFIAHKGIRADRYSKFNFQYQYLPGHTYEIFADYSDSEISFGFSAWTYEGAKNYCDELVVTCKVYYEDVARVVYNGGNIRCSKITILD